MTDPSVRTSMKGLNASNQSNAVTRNEDYCREINKWIHNLENNCDCKENNSCTHKLENIALCGFSEYGRKNCPGHLCENCLQGKYDTYIDYSYPRLFTLD